MADFDDITGWRDELKAFRQSDEGKAYFEEYEIGSGKIAPKMPFENALELAGLMLRHQEIYQALLKGIEWNRILEERPNFFHDHPDYWDLNPVESHETRNDFMDWYAFKSGLPYDDGALHMAEILAKMVERKELPALRSPQAEAYARSDFEIFFEFDGKQSE
ncbi:hypothetical protein K1718_09615 [Roseibium porphyridii]|uniref:Uncharacterized protein n=1 Tax=Roseibium porphyridii TaxID=2866279 RepID=A0ABY8FEC4_9HYPH|nr:MULTISPECIES: hypothetical protein [Stappiaceae]QFT30977.1 hypothetical protein FIV00_10855 [Labrenzia sp. THAF82]WFE91595.1 hypothetical protein K1718_09615 [Roseibium sp. KMA01]